jgi:molybdopterin-guanine dinucleotide biosynthesis protein A
MHPKIGVIILARANYGRWPDKVLYQLCGKTILEHVIIKSKQLDCGPVIVSTTGYYEDRNIRCIAERQNVNISTGEPDDRTLRYWKAIEDFSLDYFLSISPAVPFFDVEFTSLVIKACRENLGKLCYVSGCRTDFIQAVWNRKIVEITLQDPDRDEEVYTGKTHSRDGFPVFRWHDPRVKNKYLFDANIAYRIQADNHKRICDHLGHFPRNYEEINKALLEIK